MRKPSPKRVVRIFHASQGKPRVKTAGEVRFIKDRSGDASEWAWNTPPMSAREISSDYEFNPKNMKPLATTLRSLLSALGFAMSAYTTFTKTKSSMVSPDGALGGRGYIMKIQDIRRQLMNCIEVISSLSDTLYDEINAPHWHPDVDGAPGKRERGEVQDILEDVEEIRQDPEAFAREEEAEMDAEHKQKGMADVMASRLASLYVGG